MRILKIDEIKANKALIFDSSSLITLNMLGMNDLLKELKVGFDGKFLITQDVYNECVNVPMEIKKYELRALMIKKLVEGRVLEVVGGQEIITKTQEILEKINSIVYTDHEKINLVHRGEASCIAVYELLKINNKALVIDERTTRMILENPASVAELIANKVHKKIYIDNELATFFKSKRIKIIRSSEILFIGYEKKKTGFEEEREGLDALMYGAKAYGCSISDDEIMSLIRPTKKVKNK
ncbi:MAG: hypothetical protein QW622_01425 [Candidatus Pacearchaeota archaeon]